MKRNLEERAREFLELDLDQLNNSCPIAFSYGINGSDGVDYIKPQGNSILHRFNGTIREIEDLRGKYLQFDNQRYFISLKLNDYLKF